MLEEKKGRIFLISGPSGAGEDSIIKELKKIIPLKKMITYTTRAMRENEIDGRDYYFISKEEFKKKIEEDYFFEHAIQGNGHYYGLSFLEIAKAKESTDVIFWKIDYKGVMSAKKVLPNAKSIFISVPLASLEKRIRARDKRDEAYIKVRMDYAREWLGHKDIYDYEVENLDGKLDEAVEKVLEIIRNN